MSLPLQAATARPSPRLRWPLPALLAWTLAWALFMLARQGGLAFAPAWGLAALAGAAAATLVAGRWRQLLMAVGFPLSSLALGISAPAWLWGLAALPLALAYPLRAWADAPFFPTPRRALLPLGRALPLPAGARVLDAGCGLGHGLRALRSAWPSARLEGVEWSAPMAWLCAWRRRDAQVRRGDMWATSWQAFDVVYLFQRPESMARAWAKARAELRPGAWLVSLEFEVPGEAATLQLPAGRGRSVWCYRMPAARHSTLAPRCR